VCVCVCVLRVIDHPGRVGCRRRASWTARGRAYTGWWWPSWMTRDPSCRRRSTSACSSPIVTTTRRSSSSRVPTTTPYRHGEHTSQPVSGSTNLLTHDQVNKIPRTGYFVAVIMFDFRSLIPRSKQITMGHGSSGSTSLSGSRGSRVSSRDPLTHLVVLTGNCNSRES